MDLLELKPAIELAGEEIRKAIAGALLGETTSISALVEQALAGLDGWEVTISVKLHRPH